MAGESLSARKNHGTGLFFTLLIAMSLGSVSANFNMPYRHRLGALRTQLLRNYSRHFAPLRQAGELLTVDVGYSLSAILDLNANLQMLSSLSYVSVEWVDEDLGWSEPVAPGVDFIDFSSLDIWTPRLFVVNGIDAGSEVLDRYETVLVSKSGLVSAHLSIRLSTTCDMDVTYYPFDTQHCQIIFVPVYGDRIRLRGRLTTVPFPFTHYGEWLLSNVTVTTSNLTDDRYVSSVVIFRLTMKRYPLFYLCTIIIPVVLLSITGAYGFLLPLQCGEKVSFQVAIMVSLAVFLNFINEATPKTTTSVSRLALYVDLLLTQSCFSILATLVVLRGHYYWERLDQEDKEKRLLNGRVAPGSDDQTMGRETTPADGECAQTNLTRARRILKSVRHAIRRWYCCCCCMPPHYLDTFFFVIFLFSAITAPFIMIMR